MTKLRNYAKVIRSKNSGPFQITFDIMFPDKESYARVKKADVLNVDTIKRLYNVSDDEIVTHMWFEPALAYKFTLKRSPDCLQGSLGERDTFGTQQHAPLLDIEVPEEE
jgi:hypothetical protein